MHKRTMALCFLLISTLCLQAQLKSPAEFLGYATGSRFTPHSKIVDYFDHAALQSAGMVKLQRYGQTNEGRPLLLAFVSSAENIQRLESIRANNLGLAGVNGGNANANTNGPVIVWLSYNVHGNEPSSSEAAMLTLFALTDPSNARTKEWLKNTVVVIDPCINPDGRDRYVNWFNSVSGKNSNPDADAREHHEPWPYGRTNHYYFDLNRDWAWQVQAETQQRMKVYNEWLPQVHVDFHEQYPSNTYYFAPAAQPYHENITAWQREFQTTIGRNHARYFDEQGWLYYTKEYYDILYPSYGDTYPLFNGAIGMTYEQAGHRIGGTSLLLASGDTLTLADRVQHHFTTGLSTIETSSKNASRLLSEFQSFFQNTTKNGVGEYKAFIIKDNSRDRERIRALLNLLEKNGVRYGNAKAASLKAFNYNTGKEETINLATGDWVISMQQPKGVLAKVLLEPNATVVDSNTYDITAWSLPYAYGLNTFATRQAIEVKTVESVGHVTRNPSLNPYGYVIHWDGVEAVKLVSRLLQEGIRLRFSEQPFEIGTEQFDRGSVIIVRTSNQQIPDLWERVRKHANELNIVLTPVSTGFVDKGVDFGSGKIHLMKKREIALVTGDGVSANASGEIWHFFDEVLDYPLTMINLSDFNSINWSKYDVMILPNGNYDFLNDKAPAEKLKNWVSSGGHLIALENAVLQLAGTDWAIKSKKKDDSKDTSAYTALRRYEDRERDFIPNITPGSIFKIQLENTHPLAFGYPNYYYTLKMDDNIYEFMREGGWNVGVLKKDRQVSGFVGSRLIRRLQDGLLFGVQDLGAGTITYFSDNPMFRGFWENGKLMFCNALFLVGQ